MKRGGDYFNRAGYVRTFKSHLLSPLSPPICETPACCNTSHLSCRSTTYNHPCAGPLDLAGWFSMVMTTNKSVLLLPCSSPSWLLPSAVCRIHSFFILILYVRPNYFQLEDGSLKYWASASAMRKNPNRPLETINAMHAEITLVTVAALTHAHDSPTPAAFLHC